LFIPCLTSIYSSDPNHAAITGTGACLTADITNAKGTMFTGQATCTNTTGASTLIITPGLTALNGWFCDVHDTTTGADIPTYTFSQTSCTATFASVSANDVIQFHALPY
jgi:hypothetical protein